MTQIINSVRVNDFISGDGVSERRMCRVATTAAGIIASSFTAGSAIDGITLALSDRILIKNQALVSENGIYVVTAGAAVRASDLETGMKAGGIIVRISAGTVNAGRAYYCSSVTGSDTVGTHSLTFIQAGDVTLTDAQTLTNKTMSTGSTWSGNTISVPNGGTGSTSITGVVIGNGAAAFTSKTNPAGAFVGDTDAQTLTNKTLTSPTINTATISGGTINNASIGATTASTGRFTTVTATSTTNQILLGTTNVLTLNSAQTGSAVLTIPDLVNTADTIALVTKAQTLTNKTLSTGSVWNGGTISVAFGGTGATTLTGVVIGNGTSAFTTKTNPTGAFVGDTDVQTLTNKTLTSPTINTGTINNTDILGGTINNTTIGATTASTGRFTTIAATNTTNQIALGTTNVTTLHFPAPAGNILLTFPTTADTMVGRATTDTLTNKTLVDASTTFANNIDATKRMQFQLSGITTGTIRTMTIPNTSDTLVTLDFAQTLTNKNLTTASVFMIDATNPTKRLAFSTVGSTASTTLTLATLQSTSQTLNVPNITTTDTISVLALPQTYTATKTFSVAPVLSSLTALRAVVTDNSKTLTSLEYTNNPTASTIASRDANSNMQVNNLIEGYATTATSGGNTVLTVSSAKFQFFTGVAAHTVTMPVASTLVVGQSWNIVNNSTDDLTVNSSGGNLISVILPNSSGRAICIVASGTDASSWELDYNVTSALLYTTGAPVDISGAAPPTNGQVLTATSPTTAAWQTPIDNGITSINSLTAVSQTFATGTTGTDFNISSSVSTHTFNIPDASATNRGLVTTGAQTFAGVKTFSSAPVISTITNTGTLTLPTTTDTLVGRATTDTLTNKTLTSPTINGGTLSTVTLTSPTINTATISGGTINNASIGATTASTGRFTTVTATNTTNQILLGTTNVLTLNSSQTGSAVLTIPDLVNTADTVALVTKAQTLTNKTFSTGSVWNGGTIGVAFGGTGATSLTGVIIGNGTSAFTTKTNPTGAFVGDTDTQTLTNKSLVTTSTFIVDNVDATKRLQFSTVGNTTGITLTLASLQSTSQTISFPNVAGADTVNVLGTAQTITATKTFSVTPVMSFLTASQLVATDGSKNLISVNYLSTATANTVALRDASGNLQVNNLIDGYTSITSTGGTTLMAPGATKYQYIYGTLTHTMRLPNTGILALGYAWIFKNSSTQSISIATFDTSALGTLLPGDDCMVVCVIVGDNTVGGWRINYNNLASQLRTTGAAVSVIAAAPPSVGQVLTATAATTAAWQTPTAAITTLNTLTAATQTFATGTVGTDFNISSSVSTHTFNIPDASATNRGLVTTGAQTFAGVKTFSSAPVISTITNTGTLTLPTTTDTLVGRATTDTLTNKTLTSPTINTATISGGTINNASIGATTASTGRFTTVTATNTTNQILLGTTNVLTLNSSQTGSAVLTIPDLVNTADTVALVTKAQTLTNKTFSTGSVWNGGTIEVAFGGTGATSLTGVIIGNGTSAFTTKTNPAGAFVGDTDTQTLTNKSLVTTSTFIVDNVDATKRLQFSTVGNTTGITLTLASLQSTSQTISFPNVAGADTVMTLATNQTISSTKTFSLTPVMSFLTISQLVATDGSKNLVSVNYLSTATASTVMLRDPNANVRVNNVIENYVAVTTSGGTFGVSANQPKYIHLTGTLSHTVQMPVTNLVVLGQSWSVKNRSTQSISIIASDSSVIISVLSGDDCWITCIDVVGTTNAAWSTNINGSATQLRTTGSPVSVLGAAPPSAGQILTAVTPTTATWQNNTSITSINSLTTNAQTLAVGTLGTDFAISSSGSTHTFNLPDASATNRGLVTTGAQTFAGVKTFNASPVISTITNTGTLTLPTTTDTLVGRATTDTLTNKTLTSPTINTATISGGTINNASIGATTASTGRFTTVTVTNTTNQILLGTTNVLTLNSSQTGTATLTIPDLVNTADTVALVTKAQTLTNKNLVTTSTFMVDNADATKRIQFSTSGNTTGITLTLASLQSTSQTISFPNVAGADTVNVLGTAQTITATKTFSVTPVMSFLTASQLVATDGSKNLVSVNYSVANSSSTVIMRDVNGNANIINLLDGYVVVGASGGITAMAVNSAKIQYIMGSLTHTMQMPDATTLQYGQWWLIKNLSTQSISITTFDTSLLGTLLPRDDCTVLCINPTINTTNAWIVSYNNLASQLRTTGAAVSVIAAAPPSVGQVLTATAATTAAWQTPTAAITTLNTLTAATQTFATGTTGTDFNISSSVSTHTFNIPDASATNRGLVTTGTQTFAGAKTFSTAPVLSSLTASQLVATNGANTLVSVNYVSIALASTVMFRDATANVRVNNMLENYTTTVTSGGTTLLSVGTSKQQHFTGTSTHTVQMATTSTLVLGQSWLIKNRSTLSIAIIASDSSAIATLLTGDSCVITCIDIVGTTSAAWSININGLATQLRSATTNINVVAATAPTAGQVLTATSGTAATWQTPTAAITTLNTLTATTQTFATGTTGTDFNISSSTSTHTFNIPDASATNRGLVTTGAQTFAGVKTFSSAPVISTITNTGTLTLPTTTDTLVGRATTDTLTNKTLTSPTINTATISGGTINNASIGATTASTGRFTTVTATNTTNQILLGTTNVLTLNSSQTGTATLTIPDLVNTADTVALVTKAQTLTNKNLVTTSTFMVDGTDATKRIQFSTSGNTTGITLTLASLQSTSQTISFPNVAGADTVMTLATNQTISSTKTFSLTPVMSFLTISQLVATDGSKNLVSVNYLSTATASTVMLRDPNANVRVNNVIENYVAVTTSGGTFGVSANQPKYIHLTGTLSHTVQMPVTNLVVLGQSWSIKNRSTQSISIIASDSSVITSVLTGDDCWITCIDVVGTTNAAWSTNINGLATQLRSATTNINVVAATAPTAGQVLTATSSTAATWQAPSGGDTVNTVSTASATPTTISTIATSNDTVYFLVVKIVAKTTPTLTSAAGYELRATYKNNGGTLSQVGADDKLSIENVAGWDVSTSTSGTNIIVVVLGDGSNISWKASWSVVSV